MSAQDTTPAPQGIDHPKRCQRRRPPILRAAWDRTPELWCPECGRTSPAPQDGPPDRRAPPAAQPAHQAQPTTQHPKDTRP